MIAEFIDETTGEVIRVSAANPLPANDPVVADKPNVQEKETEG